MKVVFLDFDGVITSLFPKYAAKYGNSKHFGQSTFQTADPDSIQSLNKITETTGAVIVVTSTWRLYGDSVWLFEKLWSWGATGWVLGQTKRLLGGLRSHEILHWLHGDLQVAKFVDSIESYVILDDNPNELDALKHKLVLTNKFTGLTMAHADEAIKILSSS